MKSVCGWFWSGVWSMFLAIGLIVTIYYGDKGQIYIAVIIALITALILGYELRTIEIDNNSYNNKTK